MYSTPPGTHGTPNATILSAAYNGNVDDVATDLNTPRPIVAGGTGATTPAGAVTALGAVAKAGDTMTGHLTLPDTPAATNAVRKDYVDAADALKVAKAGDTMTGQLQLNVPTGTALKINAGTTVTDLPVLIRSATQTPIFYQMDGAGRAWMPGGGLKFCLGGTGYSSRGSNAMACYRYDASAYAGLEISTSVTGTAPILSMYNSADQAWSFTWAGAGGQSQINVNGQFYFTENVLTTKGVTAAGNMTAPNFMSSGSYLSGSVGTLALRDDSGNNQPQVIFYGGAQRIGSLWWYSADASVRLRNDWSGTGSQDLYVEYRGQAYLARYISGKQGQDGGYDNAGHNWFWSGSNVYWYIGGTQLGYISVTSDYRIKKDIANLGSMWNAVRSLRPIKYTHKDYTATPSKLAPKFNRPAGVTHEAPEPVARFVGDDNERWGFLAHELQQALIPTAATGHKDAPDLLQSPNPWTVIAALTKALQEAMARIEALESAGRVSAL